MRTSNMRAMHGEASAARPQGAGARGSKRHDGRLLRPNADCPEPGEVKKQHALGSRHLRRLVPPMDLAGIMIAT